MGKKSNPNYFNWLRFFKEKLGKIEQSLEGSPSGQGAGKIDIYYCFNGDFYRIKERLKSKHISVRTKDGSEPQNANVVGPKSQSLMLVCGILS